MPSSFTDTGIEFGNGRGIESESQLFVLIFICGVYLHVMHVWKVELDSLV